MAKRHVEVVDRGKKGTAAGGGTPFKVVNLVNLEPPPAKTRRVDERQKGEVLEIYKEEVDGVRMFRCPFCDINTFGSDVKFRRHLKAQHPKEKILLRDNPRNRMEKKKCDLPSLEMFFPKPILPKVKQLVTEEKCGDEVGDKISEELSRDNQPQLVIEEDHSDKEFYILPDPDQEVSLEIEEMATFIASQGTKLGASSLESPSHQDKDKRGEGVRLEICGVCGGDAEVTEAMEAAEAGQGNESEAVKVVNRVLGSVTSPHMCPTCHQVASHIATTKENLAKLQRQLSLAVSKLLDLASLGKRLMEEDLEQGGLCCPGESKLVVRVVEEGRLERGQPHLGLCLVAEYLGKVLAPGEVMADDGSSPDSAEADCDDTVCLYLTQGEWAWAGLGIKEGVVQVPPSLVTGLGASKGQSRVLLSRALASDLPRPYICLHCEHSFSSLGSLASHVTCHSSSCPSSSRCLTNLTNSLSAESFSMDDFEDALIAEKRIDQGRVRQLNRTDKYRVELRSYMHQQQFKECLREVPSLEKPFQCKECNKTFERAHDLWGHHASFRSPAFRCNFQGCEEVFLRLPDFAVHYAAHGGQTLVIPDSTADKKTLHITCPVCHVLVPGLYKLQRHKMKHDTELKYKCPACPKQFVKANTLRMHITNVHKSETKEAHRCKSCQFTAHSDAELQAHVRKAHDKAAEDTTVCGECGEIFLQKEQLAEHRRSHEQKEEVAHSLPEAVMCPECEVTLPPHQSLTAHFAAAHSGLQQRFQCSECCGGEPRLLSLEGARRHYRQVHTSRPHTCWLCKENFTKEQELHLHLASSHPHVVGLMEDEKPLQCKYCTSVFSSHMERVSHTRHSHMVETIDITNTHLDEVTMVGGHVIEFGVGSDQIVALHTIP